ncbi:MAG: glycoside hydrolase family 88 protein [Maribacter dokdonensis]|uniref:Unsaturated chondroitin disaccharide hydrolase n=3 Tax=Maribacter dokdonensis TaxID=320912 RepID=A0A1H4UI09_9FLAO|nr:MULTISPECIES: glycoside hydrolase family 88 protein [Maribacter]APA63235.1 glucuronyl hydrolase [Maribacter sp. 1_2014MBL_MicDiv]KSA12185.1 Unsaturated glucuronyl hydrolase, family GH88 [Maribacter dokdonensis DSW-8]MBU2902036.1 glycoside hydrolase family 88 protein [Maribacter dokdonensis]MDP2525137.1 glycoside hydrolase family 88 protein [Maribacter dokdonensis]CAG2533634.1 unsaturated chondroitin disaccharide hydrolase [Maribacter dokdonensis]
MNRLFLLLFVLTLTNCSNQEKNSVVDTKKILSQNVEKTKETLKVLTPDQGFARNIPKEQTNWELVGVKDWCSGFWPGVIWYAYEASGDEELREQAEKFTAPLKSIAYSPAENHDIGFMLYTSYGNGYRLTNNEEYKNVLLAAADTLATLYNPNVGSILSWPSQTQFRHNTIIDNMMNLELLFWAAKNGGKQELYNVAESHALVTMKNLVRKDSAIYHVGSFDETTGDFLKGQTHQGYADESMWARGQAWGIYGFSVAYRETHRKEFLDTAIKVSEHYLNRLPQDGIPYWDFDDVNIPDAPKDASAAAIAACGLLELSKYVPSEELSKKYITAARKTINLLSEAPYYSGETNQALLLHSTGHLPHDSEIDIPIIYADYYFMEALLRLQKMDENSSQLAKS